MLQEFFKTSCHMFVNFDDPVEEVVKEVKSSEPEFNKNLLRKSRGAWNYQ